MPIFTATLFTIAKRWKKFKYPSVNESINKMWTYTYVCMCICIKEYYSDKNEVLNHAGTWMDLENIIKKTIKVSYCIILLL